MKRILFTMVIFVLFLCAIAACMAGLKGSEIYEFLHGMNFVLGLALVGGVVLGIACILVIIRGEE